MDEESQEFDIRKPDQITPQFDSINALVPISGQWVLQNFNHKVAYTFFDHSAEVIFLPDGWRIVGLCSIRQPSGKITPNCNFALIFSAANDSLKWSYFNVTQEYLSLSAPASPIEVISDSNAKKISVMVNAECKFNVNLLQANGFVIV